MQGKVLMLIRLDSFGTGSGEVTYRGYFNPSLLLVYTEYFNPSLLSGYTGYFNPSLLSVYTPDPILDTYV